MQFKSTTWLLAVVILLGGLTYYLEVVVPEKKEASEKATTSIISLVKDQINFIKVERGSETIELQRGTDGWDILAPVKDHADNEVVESYLTELIDQRAAETAREGTGIEWKTYGLENPKMVLELKNAAGASVRVAVSPSTNFEGKLYLRRNNEDKVLIGENRWQGLSDKKVFDFRDKRLLRGRSVSIDEIQWQVGKETVKLRQADDQWKMPESTFKLDVERVKSFLGFIQDARVAEFVSDVGLTKELAEQKKIKGSPLGQLKLQLKDRLWEADFYRSTDGQFFAFLHEPKFLVKLNSGEAEKFLKIDRIYFRDHKEPFLFSRGQDIKVISFESPLKKWRLERQGQDWKLADGSADQEVDQQKVTGLIDKLRGLEATEFLGNKPLKKPLENRLVLRDEKGSEIQNFQWGNVFKKKIEKDERSFFIVQTSLLKELVTVDGSHFDGIVVQDIFKSKNSPRPTVDGKTENKMEPGNSNDVPFQDQDDDHNHGTESGPSHGHAHGNGQEELSE